MRVALLTDAWWPRINGVTVSVQTFRDELEKQGHQTIVLCPEYPGDFYDPPSPRIKRFSSFNAIISREDRIIKPWLMRDIASALDEFKPDIVHSNSEFTLYRAARLWCRKHKKPVFITCHTNWELYIKHYIPWVPEVSSRLFAQNYMRYLYKVADYVLVPGSTMSDTLESYGVKGPFHIQPTGIDPAVFQVSESEIGIFRASIDIQKPSFKGKKILLFVGRFGEEKNIGFLIPVLQAVLKKYKDVGLLMYGNGPIHGKFLHKVQQAGLEDFVHAPGYLPHDQLRKAYRASRIFVFPSCSETQGLSTVEAMMCGTPVVAIGEMGTKEVMKGDNGGYMVAHEVEAFANAVIRLLSDDRLYESKCAEARAWAEFWQIDKTTRALVEHYKSALMGSGCRERIKR